MIQGGALMFFFYKVQNISVSVVSFQKSRVQSVQHPITCAAERRRPLLPHGGGGPAQVPRQDLPGTPQTAAAATAAAAAAAAATPAVEPAEEEQEEQEEEERLGGQGSAAEGQAGLHLAGDGGRGMRDVAAQRNERVV